MDGFRRIFANHSSINENKIEKNDILDIIFIVIFELLWAGIFYFLLFAILTTYYVQSTDPRNVILDHQLTYKNVVTEETFVNNGSWRNAKFEILSISSSDDGNTKNLLRYNVCNIGSGYIEGRISIYYTDKEDKTFYWNNGSHLTLKKGACFESYLNPSEDNRWNAVEFDEGIFLVKFESHEFAISIKVKDK